MLLKLLPTILLLLFLQQRIVEVKTKNITLNAIGISYDNVNTFYNISTLLL